MMPILPANAVSRVRPFFVSRFLKDRFSAVKYDIRLCFKSFLLNSSYVSFAASSSEYGMLSSLISPSNSLTILVLYCSASSGLCVTMITRRSFAISFKRSIICTLVSVSSAPVGSSASRISGSLMSARAIATRCICPPDIWFGFLWI